MPDDQLSREEMQQLREIATALPAGHPAQAKVNLLLNSQPTEFEKARPGKGITLEGAGSAAVETAKGMIPKAPGGGNPVLSKEFWLGDEPISFRPQESGLVEAGREAMAGYKRGGEGSPSRFSGLSRIGEAAISGLGALVGVSAKRQAEHAARGEGGAIIGETAVPAGAALASYAGPKMLPKVGPANMMLNAATEHPAVTRLLLGGERAAALQELAGGRDIPTPKPIGAPLPSSEEFYENRGRDIMRRGIEEQRLARATPKAEPVKPDPFAGMTPTLKPIGHAELPPPGSVKLPQLVAPPEPLQAIAVPSEEGVPGSLPKPSGRLVLLPQEAQAIDQLQKIAKQRASEHGMMYAGGMRPAGGGRVPLTPTRMMTEEYPGPRQLEPIAQPEVKQIEYKPSEKAATMGGERKNLGPEFEIGERTHEIERNKAILRNPRATSEDVRVAQDRLKELETVR